jgi:ribonuclease BN (tRNA processing enzyme)
MSEISLKVIGCGNAFNQNGYSNSSFLIETKDSTIVIDFGFTTLLALQKNNFPLEDVNKIMLTHFHGDHFGGLPAFFLARKYLAKTNDPLKIIGPIGTEEKVRSLQQVLYSGTENIFKEINIEFVELEANTIKKIDELDITTFQMEHTPESIGYMFDANLKIGFTGDTTNCEGLQNLIATSDIIIGECSEVEIASKVSHLDFRFYRKQNSDKSFLLCHYNENVRRVCESEKLSHVKLLEENKQYKF